ncbi:MAG TPA: hypothetical protein VH475_01050, partial [Tepidisphaeraceae bacterium]
RGDPTGAVMSQYIPSAARLVRSRRIVDMAMAGPDWGTTWPKSPQEAQRVLSQLSAQAGPGPLLEVSYLDTDATGAEGRVRAIATAYYNYSAQRAVLADRIRVQLLEQRGAVVLKALNELESEILHLQGVFSVDVDGLKSLQEHRLKQVLAVENAMHEIELRNAQAMRTTTTRPSTAPAMAALRELLDHDRTQLAEVSRLRTKLADLEQQRERAVAEKVDVQRRIDALAAQGAVGGNLSVIGFEPATVAVDHRPRNAAWGALAGLGAFAFVLISRRWWRKRLGSIRRRAGFPVITEEQMPRPVLPIEASDPAAEAAAPVSAPT